MGILPEASRTTGRKPPRMRQGRLDPWRASLDVQHALQARLEEVSDPESDPEARHLMAQVSLAKATSFIALLRADGRLLDVTDAPLTAASRSSSPRAARSPTASARRSGSPARTPSCRC